MWVYFYVVDTVPVLFSVLSVVLSELFPHRAIVFKSVAAKVILSALETVD